MRCDDTANRLSDFDGRRTTCRQVDRIGAGMNSWDKTNLIEERNRIFALNSNGNPPIWISDYAFTNREEFFAEVSAFFLTNESAIIQMAIDSPVLYDTLRSYYYKPWAPASEVALVESNP